MLPRNHPDRIRIVFDDRRLVANAGLILPATLALRLGLPELVQQRLDLGNAPGRANTGDKVVHRHFPRPKHFLEKLAWNRECFISQAIQDPVHFLAIGHLIEIEIRQEGVKPTGLWI